MFEESVSAGEAQQGLDHGDPVHTIELFLLRPIRVHLQVSIDTRDERARFGQEYFPLWE